MTGLCPDVQIEISRYLTLDDTINAFSISILPYLRQAHTKVHLVDAPNPFLQIIPQHLDRNQISSVRLHGILVESRWDSSAFHAFDQLVSLTLLNPQRVSALPTMLRSLPTVRAISLWFDDEFQFPFLQDVYNSPFTGVTRLQVHCAGAIGDQCVLSDTWLHYTANATIKSFIFDSGYYALRSSRYCFFNPGPCFLRSAGKFIRCLVNVRRVQFITDRYQIETFLQIEQWKKIISRCAHLDRIVIQLLGDGDFRQQAEDIEQVLLERRPGLTFRIKNAWWEAEGETCSVVLESIKGEEWNIFSRITTERKLDFQRKHLSWLDKETMPTSTKAFIHPSSLTSSKSEFSSMLRECSASSVLHTDDDLGSVNVKPSTLPSQLDTG